MAAHQADSTDLMTMTRHVLHDEQSLGAAGATGDLTILLTSIQLGCKFIANAVRKAGLANMTGLAGEVNVQGEDVKKLDIVSNEVFVNALISSGKTSVLVSEELENAVIVDVAKRGKYAVVFDPLDGSSNIDCGVSIGTIFGIYRIPDVANASVADVLKPGSEMIAAGYAMYGSCTMLVYSVGAQPVNGYTLDPQLGEFILTHPNMRVPEKGSIYSINEGNASKWDPICTQYVQSRKFPEPPAKPASLRYVGSMVADVHRTLLYGGLFMYPADKASPNGKLRVLYECFPMAYIMEKAGGGASTGKTRMLDLVPKTIHERSPIFLGSKFDVDTIQAMYNA
eukprot:CAMPEP_0114549052 /NCGR_PEP_ID=MMETSP0114-20121206/5317_1 /TAXON_ID=31324 /ORGANISM="Goniomonas sp, Strain m" /LENGTH=338 /DNA_ID=CAMNT_0001733699 /DNA_START=10 /DNA_END=1026 /DNA_ORIENTATION=+